MNRLRKFSVLCLIASICILIHATGYAEEDCPITRSDNVPMCRTAGEDDEFLSGYVQALVDMHYYEFQVKVVVVDRIAYVYNLPRNDLLSHSILCFIHDVPCIEGVECVSMECCRSDCSCSEEASEPDVCYECCMPCSPCADVCGIWFPQSTVLFYPLIADPRQVTNSAALRFNEDIISKHVGAVSFGDDFSIYRWKNVGPWLGDLQFDIEAGIFSVFDLDHVDAAMVNTDFFVAAMFSYAYDAWSWRFRLWHMSSHIGDEFLLANPGFDRKNVSDEGVDLFGSYQLSQGVRLYAGIGDIFARDKEFPEKPVYFEFGTEIRFFTYRYLCSRVFMQPFLAMHFRSWQEHDFGLDQNYALGLEWGKIQGVGRRLRIFAEYHNGYCAEGQFMKKRDSYTALKLTYGF